MKEIIQVKRKSWRITVDVPDELYKRWLIYLQNKFNVVPRGKDSILTHVNSKYFVDTIIKVMEHENN